MKNLNISAVALTVAFSVIVTGCGISLFAAKPNFYNGKYYMTGDDSCWSYSQLSANKIMCYSRKGKEKMGYRVAMSDQQLQMHMHNEQMNKEPSSSYTNQSKTCIRNYNVVTCF